MDKATLEQIIAAMPLGMNVNTPNGVSITRDEQHDVIDVMGVDAETFGSDEDPATIAEHAMQMDIEMSIIRQNGGV